MELIVLALVAGFGAASYALWKRARPDERHAAARPPAALGAGERTLGTLQVGDVVSHLGSDYVVEGVLTLDEDGRVLRMFHLTDGTRARWLAARPGDEGALLLEAQADLPVDATGPESVSYAGMPYRLTARGVALVRTAGSLGAASPGAGERVRFYEYSGAGAARLVALAGSERVDGYRGERLASHAVEILPGR